ncbi:MAG: aldo/keto reductase, partial [Deltaproteobacteria bacterium]|nr:aldo/keto reductase [Deltaproteobacteria bacterium]
ECLLKASSLSWIDGIMFGYNFRLMHNKNMRKAVEACAKAGIGLTAMKTQGGGQIGADTEAELKLAGQFLKKGYTEFQAKLKAVWENPHISSICSEMPNTTILMSNVAAALDKTKLSLRDRDELRQYAVKTSSNYCAGCSSICESAVRNRAPVGDVMRYLMYYRSYKERGRAVDGFKKIPEKIRMQLTELNYEEAEQKCPRELSIGKLMKEAVHELG